MNKVCSKCGIEKHNSCFAKDTKRKGGRYPTCRECVAERDKKRYINKREEILQKAKETYDPTRQRNNVLKRLYGIDNEEYNRMFEEQNGCCAICGKHQSKEKKALAVDHCHTTGKVRGLLCINCNSAIGKLNEDIQVIKKAIHYLKENK